MRIDILKKLSENNTETAATFSSTMRDLRKSNPKKVNQFLKAFKQAFDMACEQNLDDVEQLALLEAMHVVDKS